MLVTRTSHFRSPPASCCRNTATRIYPHAVLYSLQLWTWTSHNSNASDIVDALDISKEIHRGRHFSRSGFAWRKWRTCGMHDLLPAICQADCMQTSPRWLCWSQLGGKCSRTAPHVVATAFPGGVIQAHTFPQSPRPVDTSTCESVSVRAARAWIHAIGRAASCLAAGDGQIRALHPVS